MLCRTNILTAVALSLALVPNASGCGGASGTPATAETGGGMSEDQVRTRVAEWDAPERDAWQRPDEVVRLLGVEPGMTVVDLGAGTGYFLARLSEAVGPSGRVIALDVEPALVAHMRERVREEGLSNVQVEQVAAGDPNLGHDGIDRILAVDTWPYIEERQTYVHLLGRALRPGGQMLVVDHSEDSLRGPPESVRLLPHHVADELRHGGLTAEIVEASLPEQYVVRGTRPE